MHRLVLLVLPLFPVAVLFSGEAGASSEEGKQIFLQKCVACHTIGEGKRIGPDLKGVTDRRDIQWLKGYIQSPSSYFAKNDETAVALLKEFVIPMPDLKLKDEEVEAVVAYLGGSGIQGGGGGAIPPQYLPTLAVAGAGILLLSLISLLAGRKKVGVST